LAGIKYKGENVREEDAEEEVKEEEIVSVQYI